MNRPPISLSRRAVLRGLGLAAAPGLAACTFGEPGPRPVQRNTPEPPAPDPDVALAVTALTDLRAAQDAVVATLARHRRLAQTLAPMVAARRAHVSLLASAAPTDGPTPSASPPAGSARFAVPSDPSAARASLSAVESDLSTLLKRHAFAARSGAFARLLASMAAASAQHAALLAAQPEEPS